MIQRVEHRCLPRPARPCPQCGEALPAPAYCEICGDDLTPAHVCALRPLPHACPPRGAAARCVACGEALPAARFCATCGAEITPSHRCSAAPPTHVHRADPIHRCPAEKLTRCDRCGEILPGRAFCEDCGADVTPAHACQPKPAAHACAPHLLMPRRCSHCGEVLPTPQHCVDCGADTTPVHTCNTV